jgi:hypothetical protein
LSIPLCLNFSSTCGGSLQRSTGKSDVRATRVCTPKKRRPVAERAVENPKQRAASKRDQRGNRTRVEARGFERSTRAAASRIQRVAPWQYQESHRRPLRLRCEGSPHTRVEAREFDHSTRAAASRIQRVAPWQYQGAHRRPLRPRCEWSPRTRVEAGEFDRSTNGSCAIERAANPTKQPRVEQLSSCGGSWQRVCYLRYRLSHMRGYWYLSVCGEFTEANAKTNLDLLQPVPTTYQAEIPY